MYLKSVVKPSLLICSIIAAIGINSTTALANTEDTVTEKQIAQLQTDIALLKKQVSILSRNQQGIAKHIGLGSKKKISQPTIPLANSASVGQENAKIVIVEFTDLHCPFCKRFNNEGFPQLEEKYIDNGEVRFVGKHFPITQLHKNAFIAAQALECSRNQKNEQNEYKKAKTWLFEQGKEFNSNMYEAFSSAQSLDHKQFETCMASEESNQTIKDDLLLAKKVGIKRTPSFAVGLDINGQLTDWRTFSGGNIAQFDEVIQKYRVKLQELQK